MIISGAYAHADEIKHMSDQFIIHVDLNALSNEPNCIIYDKLLENTLKHQFSPKKVYFCLKSAQI